MQCTSGDLYLNESSAWSWSGIGRAGTAEFAAWVGDEEERERHAGVSLY